MARARTVLRLIRRTVRLLMSGVHYLQRRRMQDAQRPQLRLDFIHPPYWGAEKLEFGVTNTGGGSAHNCRYCRLQEFTMVGPSGRAPSFSARRWYGSDRLDVPSGRSSRSSARLTLSECPQRILGDMTTAAGEGGEYRDALVCTDSAGFVYRFHCHRGPDAPPDVWSAGPFDRWRRVSPPDWAQWAARPAPIERVSWNEVP